MPAAPADETIRILFVIGTLDVGGAERQLVELASHLDSRFSPSVCCLSAMGPLAADLTASGVPVTALGFRGVRQLQGWRFVLALARFPFDVIRFVRLVRQVRPTIVHGFLLHAYVLGAFAGALTRVPVVVASRRSLGHFKRQRRLLRTAERWANRRTDLVVANSEAVRQDALASENLDPAEVIVIHNGLDPALYGRAADPALRQELRLSDGPVLIVVANFIAYKGHRFFLEALAEVCRVLPGTTALLVGEGPTRESSEAQARALGIGDRARFLGQRRDVPALLAVSDLLVHPSLEEGFCNAVIEAMAAGRPVVATDVGGNRESVISGETGLLVPAESARSLAIAMLDVLQRPDRGRAMGEAGRARALAEFDRSTMVRRYEQAYDGLRSRLTTNTDHVRHRRAR